MKKDKIIALTKYLNDLKSRQTSDVPKKHEQRVESYKAFLSREIRVVSDAIDRLRLVDESKLGGK